MFRSVLMLFLLLTAELASACAVPHPPRPVEKALAGDTPAWWVGPGVSGAWFDASRNGEGIILEMLPDGRVLAIWFTYPAAGEPGEQAWLLAQDGQIDGDRIRFGQVVQPSGARFGPDFDPSQVQLKPWGNLEMQFSSCSAATVTWTGPANYGSGTRELTRLSSIDQVNCAGGRHLLARGARSAASLRSRSGAWYVPERSGEGWIVEELPDGRSIVYWFTFTPDGQQAWTLGSAVRDGNRLRITEQWMPRGTRFGADFDPADIELQQWGSLDIEFGSCNAATLSYTSVLPGYGSASRQPVRLTSLAGGTCLDTLPAVASNLAWVERARSPQSYQSEHATTAFDGQIYALGGIRAPRTFRRFDPVQNNWSELPDLPAGRDHLAAFAFAGSIYMVGGAGQGGGDQSNAAYRFDVASQRWEARPELFSTYGSQAAMLFGHAFISDEEGSLQQYDPHTRRVRRFFTPIPAGRDHAQVIAFLDEIWIIAGRFPETPSVAIYDPVSETWRNGPRIARARGGFAAASVGDRIVIGGGEVFDSGPFTEKSVEIYHAGALNWDEGPDLPIGIHGVTGAAVDKRVYFVSGSTIAGSPNGATGRVFELVLP